MNLTSRQWVWLSLVAASALAVLYYALTVEPNRVEVTHPQVPKSAAHTPVRIVQISDLHIQNMGERERLVIKQVKASKPDLIVLSGDVVDSDSSLPLLDQFLTELGPGPKVAVLGNWEYWSEVNLDALRALYETKHNTRLLVNQGNTYRFGRRHIRVIGIDDHTAGKPDPAVLKGSTRSETNIIVQHSPGWFNLPAVLNQGTTFDLCLAGHTHGGQVALFGFPIITPSGSGSFGAGLYHTAICPLYVSRGIGLSVLPVRLGARPELAVFDL